MINIENNDERINEMNMTVFNMKFMKCIFRDFKKYLFYISDLNKNNKRNEFLLLSKLMKCYYVKRINNNTILAIYVDLYESVYYSFFEKKINFLPLSQRETEREIDTILNDNDRNDRNDRYIQELPQCGYLTYRGKLNETNTNGIMKIVNDTNNS